MPRNIVLLSDGTGNSSSDVAKTNVWRLFQALDLRLPDQLAAYYDGVGTSTSKPIALIGKVFGYGLKRNVLELYKFACRNWEPHDSIYGFGFSRGAFTIRVLNGLIWREGLVTYRNEEELARNALLAYRAYREKAFPSKLPWVWLGRKLRDLAVGIVSWNKPGYAEIAERTKAEGRHDVKVRFLGLWDTVGAYGMPIEELTRGIDAYVWPMSFRDRTLPANVGEACHALALDDERTTFHPIPFGEPPVADATGTPAQTLRQVWFSGMHSNVGGGYPDDSLAFVPLLWMLGHAEAAGLRFDRTLCATYRAVSSPLGKMYDSRAGLSAYYRYEPREAKPREAGPKEGERKVAERKTGAEPVLHWSVAWRMAYANDGYAPISIPEKARILAPDGTLLSLAGFRRDIAERRLERLAAAAETPGEDGRMPLRELELVKSAVEQLQPKDGDTDRAEQVELVWDLVWWRRIFYFVTVLVTLGFVALPWLIDLFSISYIAELDDRLRGVSQFVELLRGFLPSFASPWLDLTSTRPVLVSILVAIIAGLLYVGERLKMRIHDRARAAWNIDIREEQREVDTDADIGRRRRNRMVAAVAASGALGYATHDGSGGDSIMAAIGGWPLALALGLSSVLVLARRRPRPPAPQFPAVEAHRPRLRLNLARLLRKTAWIAGLSRFVARRALPLGFILASAVGLLIVANRVVMQLQSSSGLTCDRETAPDRLREVGDLALRAEGRFDAADPCWPSGLTVQKGATYQIWVETPGDWFDRNVDTAVNGFDGLQLRQKLFTPARRWLGLPWFAPIGRIGATGIAEFALPPADPFLLVERAEQARHAYESIGRPQIAADIGSRVEMARERNVSQMPLQQLLARAVPPPANPQPPDSPERRAAVVMREMAILRLPGADLLPGWVDAAFGFCTPISDAQAVKREPVPAGLRTLAAQFTAPQDGEFFLYVNEAMLPLAMLGECFYRNNRGTAAVMMRRVPAPALPGAKP